MGCATSKHEDVYEPATPVGSPIAKPAGGTEAGRQSAAASTASNEQEAEELAAHQERNYGLRKPASESDRMRTLNTLAVLDSEPEERFDDITKLCKLIFNVGAWVGGGWNGLGDSPQRVVKLCPLWCTHADGTLGGAHLPMPHQVAQYVHMDACRAIELTKIL